MDVPPSVQLLISLLESKFSDILLTNSTYNINVIYIPNHPFHSNKKSKKITKIVSLWNKIL